MLRQNREQVEEAYFDIQVIEVGTRVKNLLILRFLVFY